MARFLLVITALVGISTAAVCGSSSAKNSEPLSDEAFLFAAQAAANGANLVANDFPAGWESEPPDPDDEDDDDDDLPEGLSPECVELFEGFDAMEEAQGDEIDALATATSDDFSSADGGEMLSTEVEVFRAEEVAAAGEDMMDQAFATCGPEFHLVMEAELNKDAEADGEEYRIANFRMLEFTERDLGDWARDWGFALTYQFDEMQVDATFTMTFVRAGRMNGTASHVRFGESDAELIDSMRELFAERLAQADAKLPE